jgi:hypothetical protein
MKLKYKKNITAEDVSEALAGKIPSNKIIVEDDGVNITITLPDDIVLSDTDIAEIDDSLKMLQRKKVK